MFGVISAVVIGAGAGSSLVKLTNKTVFTIISTIDKCVHWETQHSAYGVDYIVRSYSEFEISDDALSIMELITQENCGEHWKNIMHLWLKALKPWSQGHGLQSEFGILDSYGISSTDTVEMLMSKVREEDKALLIDFGTLLSRLPQGECEEQSPLGTSEAGA